MSNVAYVRVSTEEQNEARQKEALAAHNIDKWFEEKASGKNTHRPAFQQMMDWVREGDTVFIHDLSRIARSTKDLLSILDTLDSKGVRLVSNKESIDTSTATGKLIVTVIGAINEFERGRKAVDIPDIGQHYARYMARQTSKAALARELGISRPTLDRLFSEYENKSVPV